MSNPYLKSLKPFDPKKDLIVDETFNISSLNSKIDTLSDLASEDSEESSSNSGKEIYSYKTDSSIFSGIVNLENSLNKTVLLVCNKRGKIYLLIPEQDSLKAVMEYQIQGSIIQTPAYSNGIIYCTTREGMIYAINTGLKNITDNNLSEINPLILWQKKMEKGILTEPFATGKILIVATLGGVNGFEAYYADDSNKSIGRSLWGIKLDGVVSTPKIVSGIIYVGSEDKHFYALEYSGNKIDKAWAYELSGATRAKPCASEKNDNILVPTIDGFIYCLNRRSGEYKWNFIVKAPVYSNIISAVIGNDEYFFFGADNGIFYSINSLGKMVWNFKTNGKIRTEAVIDKEKIFFGSEDNNLYALNIKTGKRIFNFSTDGNINSRPVIVDDIIYFGSADSFVHGVSI